MSSSAHSFTASPITVDNREKEPGAEFFSSALNFKGVSAHVGFLDHGDFSWVVYTEPVPTPVFVERKTVQDLLASAEDGRLARWTDAVRSSGPGTWMSLLVEGDAFYPITFGRPWTAEQLDNLLASIQRTGCTVLRSRDAAHTVERIRSFYYYTGKPSHDSLDKIVRPEVNGAYIDPEYRDKVRMLMCLPGLGEARAKAILAVYPSLEDAFAQMDTWHATVKGIGQKIVRQAEEFWRGD